MDFLVMAQNKSFYEYAEHSHDYWEVLYNRKGTGTAIIDGHKYDFHPGTIFCIRPGIRHSKSSKEGFEDGSILIRDFCFENESEKVLIFEDDEVHSFERLCELAYNFHLNPDTDIYGERYLRSLLDAMQNLLSHWKMNTSLNPEVRHLQQIMSDHLQDAHFDLNPLIENTSYSPNHFRKIFRDQCGCSPLQYYHQLKIQLAKQQILQNKAFMTVKEIAGTCGFDDPYYFSRVFKKVTGVSPLQFYRDSQSAVSKVSDETSL